MTHFDQLRAQVKGLYALVRLQMSLRLAIRALWLGMAGMLLAWAANALWGLLPNPPSWFLVGLGFAAIPAAGILVSLYPLLADLSPPKNWVQGIDTYLHLREQFSTAWEVAQARKGGPIAHLLVQDMLGLLPHVRTQVLDGGWYRKVDLTATGVVSLLTCALLAFLLMHPAARPTAAAPKPFIPLTAPKPPVSQPQQNQASPPQPQQNESGSQPGESGSNAQGNNPAGKDSPGNKAPNDQAGANLSAQNDAQIGAVADALRQLGKDLSKQAGTYDLGQALQNLDINKAADSLQDLSSQMKDLSPESRDNLSQSLDKAAKDLQQTDPSLSKDMQGAADALKDQQGSPDQALGQVAQDLRQMDGVMQASNSAGSAAGQNNNGNSANQAPPADRLPDSNGQMQIPQESADNSGLLSPARPDAAGEGTASGSLDANQTQSNPAGQSPLLPNTFLWKWRDVVSQYFQR